MRISPASLSRLGLLALVVVTAIVGLGAACNGRPRGRTAAADPWPAGAANARTFRLYYLVDLDGYLEPCGCVRRPLGGIDRLAQLMESERAQAPHSLFVAAGDLLFRDPQLDPRMEFQETAKAEAMVRILDQLQLAAFAPGPADFVRGGPEWDRLAASGHAAPMAANVAPGPLISRFRGVLLRDVNGIRVGLVGVSDFHETPDARPPEGAPDTTDPVVAARMAVQQARSQGARVVVVLASVPRRIARTIAGSVPGVTFVIAAREESLTPLPPERIGTAYLLSAVSQGRSVGIVDVYLHGNDTTLVDASEATATAARAVLERRIADLRDRIAVWDHDPAADRAAVALQRTRLEQLQREHDGASSGRAPDDRSYFRARGALVDPDVARRADVQQAIATYFRAVNDRNHAEYASLRPVPPVERQPAYVGMEACRECHEEAFDVWDRTPHSRAYWTLEIVSKNYNLSCVSCHVTGYRRPGGAEVVQNLERRDVQCESCHGPGSLHLAAHTAASRRATIRRLVPGAFCATECHTPEHSDHFDYATYLPRILGPGHGYPVGSHDGGVSLSSPILVNGANADAGLDAHAD